MNIMFQKAVVDHVFSFQSMKYQSSTASRISRTCTSGFEYVPARKNALSSFSLSEVEALLHVYCSLYETLSAAKVEDIPQTYQKMMTLTINGQQLKAGQYVFAKSVNDIESKLIPRKKFSQFLLTHFTDQQELIILLYIVFLLVILSILTVLL